MTPLLSRAPFLSILTVLTILTLVAVTGCGSSREALRAEDTVALPSGLRYIDRTVGRGEPARDGMTIEVDYAGYFTDGRLFDTSIDSVAEAHAYKRTYATTGPFTFTLGRSEVIKGWDEGVAGMRVGGERRLIVPADLAYGKRGRPGIPGNSTLVFDVRLRDARYDTTTLMSGLRYIDLRQGSGPKIQAGMTLKVDYAGYLRDGTLFDTSIDSVAKANRFDRGGVPFEPFLFTVGRGQVISGWDEGLTTNMRVGGRRILIIPPHLAYGSGSSGVIPPNATLLFELEVLEGY